MINKYTNTQGIYNLAYVGVFLAFSTGWDDILFHVGTSGPC